MDYMTFIQTNPKISIIAFSLVVSLFISLVNYFVLDKEKMHETKRKQKALQEQMKIHQKAGNKEKMSEIQKQILSHSGDMLKHSFKPMIITLIPILIFFGYVRNVFATTSIANSWIWWYIGSAIVGSSVFRNVLKLP